MDRVPPVYKRHCERNINFLIICFMLIKLCYQWLHYLLRKLLTAKGLKPPKVARKTKPTAEMPVSTNEASFSEKDCYDCLVDLESWLGQSIVERLPLSSLPAAKIKGKKKVQVIVKPSSFNGPARVGEIIAYGEKKEWIKLTRMF